MTLLVDKQGVVRQRSSVRWEVIRRNSWMRDRATPVGAEETVPHAEPTVTSQSSSVWVSRASDRFPLTGPRSPAFHRLWSLQTDSPICTCTYPNHNQYSC